MNCMCFPCVRRKLHSNMASSADCYVTRMEEASFNGLQTRNACTHGCDQGICGDTTPHINYLAGETHNVYTMQIPCPCRTIADGLCKCSSNGFIYPELPTCFGEIFDEDLGTGPSDAEFRDAVADGIKSLTDEYTSLAANKETPAIIVDAISHVVTTHVYKHFPEHVQYVNKSDMQNLLSKVILRYFHITKEGRFMLARRYDVSWKDGNLHLEKYNANLTREFKCCNDTALNFIMEILYDKVDLFLAPQLLEMLR